MGAPLLLSLFLMLPFIIAFYKNFCNNYCPYFLMKNINKYIKSFAEAVVLGERVKNFYTIKNNRALGIYLLRKLNIHNKKE